jgi:hypothetical protein
MLNADKRGALAHNARLIKDEYKLDAVIQLWENLIQDAAAGGKR